MIFKKRRAFRINKKAQVGDIMAMIPIMFAAIFIMGIFLLVSGWIASTGHAKKPMMGVGGSQGDFLMQNVIINDKGLGEITVLEGIILFNKDKTVPGRENVIPGDLLKPFSEKAKQLFSQNALSDLCIIVLENEEDSVSSGNPYYFSYSFNRSKSVTDEVPSNFGTRVIESKYSKYLARYALNLADDAGKIKTLYLFSYYGRCLHSV